MTEKMVVGIIFGGRSVEHEVSILTGYQALEALDKDQFAPVPVYLARDNVWYVGKYLKDISFFRMEHIQLERLTRVLPAPDASRGKLRLIEAAPPVLRKAKTVQLDCVIPATHGTFGEDGCLQGILEMTGIPYAGSDVRASAVGMDKLLTKSILESAGLPYLPFEPITRTAFEDNCKDALTQIENKLPYPLFVKPAMLGSSVGISRVENRRDLEEGLSLALHFGDRAIVEEALVNFTEVNCAVLDDDPPIPSVLEQPVSDEQLLTFDEKYKGGKKGPAKGMAGQKRLIPAPLPDDVTRTVQNLAVRVFQLVGAGGVARIDFLISQDGTIFINEINNIPGSFAFYLWESMGRSFKELLTRMIERAQVRNRRRNRTTFSFETNLLA